MKIAIACMILICINSLSKAYAEGKCRSDQDYLISNYPAYAVEYDELDASVIDEITGFIMVNIDRVDTLRVIGHASAFGNTDVQTASEDRAEFVLDKIVADVESALGYEVPFWIEFQGAGADCPLASNETQEGRAENRRTQIWVWINKLPKDSKPDNSEVDEPRVDEWLEFTKNATKSAATACMVKKLVQADVDARYIDPKTLNKNLVKEIDKKVFKQIKKSAKNLADQINKAAKRLSKLEPEQAKMRFRRYLENRRRAIVNAIGQLDAQANCQDKRIIAMRRFVIDQSENKTSLYHCKAIRKKVDNMLASIGGKVKGCTVN